MHEFEWRRPAAKGDYAGGMTEGDLQAIEEESARLRAKVKAKRDAISQAA
ncbi:DNA polymerase alpha, subunit B [Rhodovulum sulfidophilum]|uniref:DNA polymerase alpha, subunit B n=1 Tax=Rhodovulum sulfidophilum TaxID=35806 RepID=A0A0D6B8B3_RHOSU|nr:DNA polymerase alpha, subunit B [Rhodovulum sulfidophilum]BAQ71256.1 DNA polymerase alpha, subunit B [Rhodovulum sulfidophilum]